MENWHFHPNPPSLENIKHGNKNCSYSNYEDIHLAIAKTSSLQVNVKISSLTHLPNQKVNLVILHGNMNMDHPQCDHICITYYQSSLDLVGLPPPALNVAIV